jgi:predicted nucleic acid-binding protein
VNYLLDSSVISAVAPTRKDRPTALVEWLDLASNRLYLSVVTAAEISDGIAKAAREGAARKAANLKEWWDAVEHLYRDRILPFDLRAAHIAGDIRDAARAAGHDPGFADIVIAATAAAHGLTILTRNVKHFRPIADLLINPFEGLPPLTGGHER